MSTLERTDHDELGRVPFQVLFTFGDISNLNLEWKNKIFQLVSNWRINDNGQDPEEQART